MNVDNWMKDGQCSKCKEIHFHWYALQYWVDIPKEAEGKEMQISAFYCDI
jgi:hypothetical protein